MKISAKPQYLAFFLLAAFAFDSLIAASMAKTTDEDHHVDYGKRVLQLQPDRLHTQDDSKMPVSALNAFPSGVAKQLDNHHVAPNLTSPLRSLYATRFATVLALLVLDIFIYLWAYELYGTVPAFAAAGLAVLSPSLAAHGTLATTDLYFTLGVVSSLFYLRRYLLDPTLQNAVLSAFALALAQLAKSFALFLYGVAACFLLCFALPYFRRDPATRLNGKRVAAYVALAAVFFIAVVNVGFCFDRSFTRLADYRFETPSFTHLQQISVLRSVPIPVPYPFLQGLDMMKNNEQTGVSFGNVYLLGKLRKGTDPSFHGFKFYYLVALFFKEPIPIQILGLIGLVWIARHRRREDFLCDEALLLMSGALLFIWMSFFNRAQIGIRQVLPLCAIDVIIASAAFVGFAAKPRFQKVSLGLVVVWLVVSVASYYPNMIPYMNEWAFDRKMNYQLLADSNLDWGQNAFAVSNFLRNNPDVIVNPTMPVSGVILVQGNLLDGVLRDAPDQMAWLRSRYKPVSQVGYADFLFVVPPSDFPDDAPPAARTSK